jgi:hypothetical protein
MIRKATIFVALGLVAAVSVATAGTPSPANCIWPAYFDVYACKLSVPDPLNAVNPPNPTFLNRVFIGDIGNNGVPGAIVKLRFCTDVKLYNAVPGFPAHVVTCSPSQVAVPTDVTGYAQFYLVGATVNGNPNGNPVGTGAGCISVYVVINGVDVLLGTATATVFDQNGANGGVQRVESTDLSAWLGDFGKTGIIGYKGRSDYNHNGSIGSTDLGVWLKVFGLGNSAAACGTLCP